VPAENPTHRRVVIELEGSGRPVSGVIRERGWSPHRFSGWLELIASLDTAQAEAGGKNRGVGERAAPRSPGDEL
jgi:hypothetical protein